MESEQSESESAYARAWTYARARLGPDFGRALTWGGGGTLALVAVALAGLYLPGLARLGLLVAGIVGIRFAPESAGRGLLRIAGGAVVGWLALAWGLGLLTPIVGTALVVLMVAEGALWWQYVGRAPAEVEAEATPLPPREPTPDERLDALLADAPLEGLPFAEIRLAMKPYMVRSTVAAKLKQRAWSLGGGRWRARPTGIDEP